MSGESSSWDVYLSFLLFLSAVPLLTQRNCEPDPLAELGLQELSALVSLIHLYRSIEYCS